MIDAGLGRQEQAVQEAEHACDLVTFENSGPSAPIVRCNLAVVYAKRTARSCNFDIGAIGK